MFSMFSFDLYVPPYSRSAIRHRKNFWAFTGPRLDFGLILLISSMIIHRSFTGPTHLLSANAWGPVSFAVSVLSPCFLSVLSRCYVCAPSISYHYVLSMLFLCSPVCSLFVFCLWFFFLYVFYLYTLYSIYIYVPHVLSPLFSMLLFYRCVPCKSSLLSWYLSYLLYFLDMFSVLFRERCQSMFCLCCRYVLFSLLFSL